MKRKGFEVYLVVLLLVASFLDSNVNGFRSTFRPSLSLTALPAFDVAIIGKSDELKDYAIEVLDVIQEATLPTRPDELIALVVGEATAGFTGGMLERSAAFVLGDKAGFQSNLRGTSTGAYFAIRSAIRSATRLAGLPAPVSRFIAGVGASIIAESLRALDYRIKNKPPSDKPKDGNEKVSGDLSANFDNKNRAISNGIKESPPFKLPIQDVLQDITKWVAYDLLLPEHTGDHVTLIIALQYGALAGIIGHVVYDFWKFKSIKEIDKKLAVKEFCQAGIEAAILFASYESSIAFIENSATPELKKILLQDFSSFNFPYLK